MVERFGNRYITIGFYDPVQAVKEFSPQAPEKEWQEVFNSLAQKGIKCYYGRWINANNARLVLLDTKRFAQMLDNGDVRINSIKYWLWKNFKIDSIRAGDDFDTPVAWSYATGMLLEELYNRVMSGNTIVAHFHEWLSGTGMLYLKNNGVPIPTVFTIHATVLGRTKSGYNIEFFKEVRKGLSNGTMVDVRDAYKYGVEAKHLMEVACAKHCDVFTVVSQGLNEEAKYVLGREADIITPNGLDFSLLPDIRALNKLHLKYKERVLSFFEAYFSPYYSVRSGDKVIFFTSGRYEFFNKGYDIFIDALGLLNKLMKKRDMEKEVYVLILVPGDVRRLKEHVDELNDLFNRLKELVEEETDSIKHRLIRLLLRREELSASNMLSKDFMLHSKILCNFIKDIKRSELPDICPFELNYPESKDLIIKRIKDNGLLNREEDRVKVIFYPRYLSIADDVFGMNYYDVVIAASMGVFPSRYESWGYTPHEAAALMNTTVTTNITGFGSFVKSIGSNNGIKILDIGKEYKAVVKDLAQYMFKIVCMGEDERIKAKLDARSVANKASWKTLIKNYLSAYSMAIKKVKE